MNRKIKIIQLSTIFMLFTSSNAFAQTRPFIHWSTFEKDASPCACHRFALDAMHNEGLNQIFEDTGMVILAGNNQAIAETVCLPGNKRIRLSAYSSDSATAERIRNNVRAKIVQSALFDTCP